MSISHARLGWILIALVLLCACAPVAPAGPELLVNEPTRSPIILPSATAVPQVFHGPLSVVITWPADNEVVSASPVTMRGEADPGTVISINDEVILVDENRTFSVQVTLEPGNNLVEITASDVDGRQGAAYLNISYEPAP